MGVRITDLETVALYDSVSGFAFGPTFPSEEAADDFLTYNDDAPDPRLWDDQTLQAHYAQWVRDRGHHYGLEAGTDGR